MMWKVFFVGFIIYAIFNPSSAADALSTVINAIQTFGQSL